MAHRRSNPPSLDWAQALNLIDVVYSNNPRVLQRWQDVYNTLGQEPVNWPRYNHDYTELLSEMAAVLGYKKLRQTQINQFYSPKAHGDQAVLTADIQKELLRVLKATETLCAEPGPKKISGLYDEGGS